MRTKISLPKTGTEVPVDYRMIRRGDQWLVYDVIVEGVSLVANYRSQFNRIIEEASYQELVRRMRTKLAEAAAVAGSDGRPGSGAPRGK